MNEKRSEMNEKGSKPILPSSGYWDVESLADHLELKPQLVQQRLTDMGIPVLFFSDRYRHRLINLEDLKNRKI